MQTIISSSIPIPSIDIFPRRVDVRTLADDLTANGLKYSIQAESLGVGWSTYQRWLAGTEPKYSDMTINNGKIEYEEIKKEQYFKEFTEN